MKNNVYAGYHSEQQWYYVEKNNELFDHKNSLKIRNHSPDGFAWGYYGSGPSQLALAILIEEFDKQFAEQFYQDFKTKCIANLPNKEDTKGQAIWVLTSKDIRDCLKTIVQDSVKKETIKEM